MSHYVPDFKMDDCANLSARSSKKPITGSEDELMELLWQNGQVIMQSQTVKKPQQQQQFKYDDAELPVTNPKDFIRTSSHQNHHHHNHNQNLFMQEDEMASWLHCPLNDTNNFDHDFCSDLLYPSSAAACITSTSAATTITNTAAANVRNQPPPVSASATVTAFRPPIPPATTTEVMQNFSYFSRHRAKGANMAESGPSKSKPVIRESTVVDSSATPAAIGSESRVSEAAIGGAAVVAVDSSKGHNSRERTTYEMTVTSSPGCSSASDERPPPQKPSMAEDRKRKGREEDSECYQSEDVDFESADAKKQARGSTSTKRSRAAEVHNLSERRRRDRINEKMKALQELIPRCNKSDKASMLDEAIEYLKSLQLQVQMMSMGCSMVPMMFPGIQQYMPPMGMGMGMGIGMGMEMGMSRPMIPFPNVLSGPLPAQGTAAHLGPRFPMPAFHMPSVAAPDPSRVRAANNSDAMLSAMNTNNLNQPRLPNFVDPYQQYLGVQQMQMPVSQNQPMAQPSSSKPGPSQGPENLDNHQSGT